MRYLECNICHDAIGSEWVEMIAGEATCPICWTYSQRIMADRAYDQADDTLDYAHWAYDLAYRLLDESGKRGYDATASQTYWLAVAHVREASDQCQEAMRAFYNACQEYDTTFERIRGYAPRRDWLERL